VELPFQDERIALNPSKIVAVAKNYRAHAAEMDSVVPSEPRFFLKPPSALLAPGGQVRRPAMSRRIDHEVELAVIIGRQCRAIREEQALDHVRGYTVFVDITARDLQQQAKEKGMPWAVAKGFDTFAPVGPRIVPASGVDPQNLDIWLKVNGEFRQKSHTSYMVFSVAHLIAYISHIMTLEPGDIIATGTPEGIGPMEPGDRVAAGIESFGVLEFSVI
jgi:2-keto-4-pentenoate hydratase/2-oxohepta-3-ene-1,7-dioic acid hydratase in catechol pathway